jgi:hypothetical protein
MADLVDERSAPSHVYYFSIGAGAWRGAFTFRVTSLPTLLASRIGLVNCSLAVVMDLVQRSTGQSRIDSTIVAKPDEGAFGVAENVVRISKFGLTLYLLRERYVLDPDGTGVTVEAAERFGPVSRLLSRTFTYPAKIYDGGMASTYYMPLLGSQWTATYRVAASRQQLSGALSCPWAEATETADRVAVDSSFVPLEGPPERTG